MNICINLYKLAGLNPILQPGRTIVYSNRIYIFMILYVLLLKYVVNNHRNVVLAYSVCISENFKLFYLVSLS